MKWSKIGTTKNKRISFHQKWKYLRGKLEKSKGKLYESNLFEEKSILLHIQQILLLCLDYVNYGTWGLTRTKNVHCCNSSIHPYNSIAILHPRRRRTKAVGTRRTESLRQKAEKLEMRKAQKRKRHQIQYSFDESILRFWEKGRKKGLHKKKLKKRKEKSWI